jgi:thiol-disulfide isomerase/thioredoxin
LQRNFIIIGLVLVVIIGMAGGYVLYRFQGVQQQSKVVADPTIAPERGVTVGKTILTFTLVDRQGQATSVGVSGKPIVLNFWASWCPPCRGEFPELDAFARTHSASVQFYAIDLQESPEKTAAFLQQNGYSLPVLLDTDGAVGHTYNITEIPTTLVVDSKGVIRFRKSGQVTAQELDQLTKGL